MREIKGVISPKPKESQQSQADQTVRKAKEKELAEAIAAQASIPSRIEDARNRAMARFPASPPMRPPVPLQYGDPSRRMSVPTSRPEQKRANEPVVENAAQLREKIRQIDQQIAQAAVAVDRNRRDRLSHRADWDEDFLKSLQQKRNRAKSQLDQHAP